MIRKKLATILAAAFVGVGLAATSAPAQADNNPYAMTFSKSEVQDMKKAYDTSTGAGCNIAASIIGAGSPLAIWACNGPTKTIEWVDKAYYNGCGLNATYSSGGYSYQGNYQYSLAC